METIKGNLITLAQQGQFDVIAHGCNCFCQMGGGIAKAIKSEFPEAYQADCQTEKGGKDKLGSCTYATCQVVGGTCVVVNAYTQYDYRGKGRKVDYDALRDCMQWIKQYRPTRRTT